MGLIREPKNVDFSGQSKPWTEKELLDFRKLMNKLKAKCLHISEDSEQNRRAYFNKIKAEINRIGVQEI